MDQRGMNPVGPLSEGDKRSLVLKLVARLRCVQCERKYDPTDFTLVHSWQDMWVLSTRCRHCNEPCHVVIFMRLDAETEPEAELVTDLTPEELEDLDQRQPITFDDVLDVHVLLEECDGDLEVLLAS
jgi:hypothetical protein